MRYLKRFVPDLVGEASGSAAVGMTVALSFERVSRESFLWRWII